MEDLQKIRAKSVVKNKFWILQHNDIKVGYASRIDKDIVVMIKGEEADKYSSVADMKKTGMFEFTELPKPAATVSEDVHGYPTEELAYNAVWNVKYRLPLYTQSPGSKSWYAAGYYKVNIASTMIVQFCPKLIALQRNDYEGPFKTDPGHNEFDGLFE